MASIKKKRLGIAIDMTPFVDVVILLLTFFMMTTQFKPQEEIEVILPQSHSELKLPETNVMTLWVASTGEIHLGFDAPRMMQSMFGDEFRLKASALVNKDELGDLLMRARIMNPKLRTIIRGHQDVEYGLMSDIMDILQKTQITRFAMVTLIEN